MLAAFSVENYRAFARRQDIEIRPLTLFYGWNSSGKSALVRFLPLLAESIQVGGSPIWLAGQVGRKITWPDLVCKATERDLLRISLRWADEELSAEWKISGALDGSWQEVKELTVRTSAEHWSYPEGEASTKCAGLVPHSGPIGSSSAGPDWLRTRLLRLPTQVQWLSGVRVPPARLATYGGGASPTLRPDGEDVLDHLIAAQLQSTAHPLIEGTQRFFSALGETLAIDNPIEGAWRVLLHPAGVPTVRVNLCDTGEGYAQVLPVLVALARTRVGGPQILCLEQPELHLHTRAQVELANLLVASAAAKNPPSLLVETHSEVVLMSTQLAIARGQIDPANVRVYWVESRADGTSDAVPVDFDAQGRPSNSALTGAFDEAIRLGQELVTLQLSKRTP